MTQLQVPGAPEIAVTLRRSVRARRMSLRVSALDGKVTLTIPAGVPIEAAQTMLTEKAAWLRRHQQAVPEVVNVCDQAMIPVAGQMVRIVADPRGSNQLGQGTLTLRATPARAGVVAEAFLKARARDQLVAQSDRFSALLGRGYTRIALRDTRSRWGSCSAEGRLMYSWRLIMAPPEVLEYVAAHEVAHLQEMHHGPSFWALVERLYPHHTPHRAWLREHGAGLHRYQFRN